MEEILYETKKVQTYGKLFVAGKEYYLLAPLPIPEDSWQYPDQQVWSVIPSDWVGHSKRGGLVYSFARSLVCSDPVIELYPDHKTIMVRTEETIDLDQYLDDPQLDE